MSLENRIQKYVQTLPPAVSGSGGQKVLWDSALKLVVGFGLTGEQAAAFLLADWNERCDPPWTEREIRRACERADQRGTAERGTLLPPGERSQVGKIPVFPLAGSQKADGSQGVLSKMDKKSNGSQSAKRGPTRRIRLIGTDDGPAYKLSEEWPNGSKSDSIFEWYAVDCYINRKPTWGKVRLEWLFVYPAPDCSPFMLWLRRDKKPDQNGVKEKTFLPFHYTGPPDGTGDFVEGNDPGGRVFPFGVVRFQFHENLIFTEGEKAAACVNRFLAEKGLDSEIWATCVPNGAGAWRDGLKEYFREKNVFVWPDNDQNGTRDAVDVCRSLEGVARSVRTLKEYPPGFSAHDDAVEVIEFYAKQRGKTDDADR